MRSLFLKIFLWFWATVIVTGLTTLTLTFRLGPRATPTRWHFGWGLALLFSGLICFVLTRFLTRPILRLQAAAQRLAAGELHARATGMELRRDEIGDLVRDFNVMATHVEDLVTSQRQLISDISHELRSPLARLTAAVGVARQRLGHNDLFDRMERDAERLNEMIGRLLTLARIEMTAALPEKQRTDLNALLSEIVADAQWDAGQRNCRIELICDRQCYADTNRELLRSAIENVIRNAIRYTAAGTAINVRLECHRADGRDTSVTRVSDHGSGVPPTELLNIFRPFYRVADARDRQSGGVGLGLAIADRVARLHGGTIEAANKAGGGLEISLSIPLRD
jgi:two-component system sensor histidine kinase CpxA